MISICHIPEDMSKLIQQKILCRYLNRIIFNKFLYNTKIVLLSMTICNMDVFGPLQVPIWLYIYLKIIRQVIIIDNIMDYSTTPVQRDDNSNVSNGKEIKYFKVSKKRYRTTSKKEIRSVLLNHNDTMVSENYDTILKQLQNFQMKKYEKKLSTISSSAVKYVYFSISILLDVYTSLSKWLL